MPCTDPFAEQEAAREYHERCTKIEAMLCAIVGGLRATWFSLPNTDEAGEEEEFHEFLDDIKWAKAGVTKGEFLAWYEDHRAKDRERLAQERREADRRNKTKKIMSKLHDVLTSDEVKLLAKVGIEAIQKYAEDKPAKKAKGKK